MQQAGAAQHVAADPEFIGQCACEQTDFAGALQQVEAVIRDERQPAEEQRHPLVKIGDPEFKGRGLAPLLDLLVELLAGPLDDLLDPRRVDPAVLDELGETAGGDGAPQRVPGRQHDRPRCVVDEQIDAGGVFEGPNVAPLAADDSALHLVAGQGQDGDRPLRGDGAAEGGHGAQDCVPRGLLRRGPGLVGRLLRQAGDIGLQVPLHGGEKLGSSLLGGQLRHLFELPPQSFFARGDAGVPLVQGGRAGIERSGPLRHLLGPAIEGQRALFEPRAALRQLRLPLGRLLDLFVELRPACVELPPAALVLEGGEPGDFVPHAPVAIRFDLRQLLGQCDGAAAQTHHRHAQHDGGEDQQGGQRQEQRVHELHGTGKRIGSRGRRRRKSLVDQVGALPPV